MSSHEGQHDQSIGWKVVTAILLVAAIALASWVSYEVLVVAMKWAQPEPPQPPGEPDIQRERPFDYGAVLERLDPQQFRRDVEALSSLGSRVAGYEGCEAAAQRLLERFREIGLQHVGSSQFPVAVPLDQGAVLTVGDVRVPVHALWPNAARTCTLPPGGVEGPLFHAATGELNRFDGRPADKAIVLMDFNCGRNWVNAFFLNAAAVVLVEPESTLSGEAQAKVVDIPLNLPRFWMTREDAERVLPLLPDGATAEGRLIARTDWSERQTSNIFGLIPGSDPELHREYVVVTAYYDSMSVVPQLAPGADQAGGIATLLQLAQAFEREPPARSVVFLATSAHHQCLKGIREAIFQDTFYQVASAVNDDVRSVYELRTRRRELQRRQFELLGQEPSPSQKAALDAVLREAQGVDRDLQGKWSDAVKPRAVVCLDLSSGNDEVGVFHTADLVTQYDDSGLLKRRFAVLSTRLTEYETDIAAERPDLAGLLFDGIDAKPGRSAPQLLAGKSALDSEPLALNGLYGITLATAYDARALVDTPQDDYESLGAKIGANGYRQARLVACLVASMLNDPKFPQLQALDDHYRTLVGSVKEFDPSSGFLPKDPVPGSVVTLALNPETLKGVRGIVTEIADARGEFEMHGLPANTAVAPGKLYPIQAYAVDPINGNVAYAPDKAEGSSKGDIEVTMDAEDKRVRIIAFPCQAVDLFDVVDHRTFKLLTKMEVLDARTDAAPMKFGFATTKLAPCAMVFVQEDARYKVLMGLDIFGWRYVLLNMTEDAAGDEQEAAVTDATAKVKLERESGRGYIPPDSGRLTRTTILAARDMYRLNDLRLLSLAESGITNDLLNSLQYGRAKGALEKAEESGKVNGYAAQIADGRHALGYLSRAYPDVMGTANDVVKGIVFYLFLLLPFSFFMERLLFGFPDINRRIAGFFGIFVITFALIAVVHPAFGLKKTLIVIPLGFVILALSMLVIFIISGRFEEEVRRLRKTTQVEHREDVGRMSAAAAAFSLGISNMRRRKMRTVLTSVTLILFMFTVLSFTSVQSALRFNRINMGEQTPYRGMMLRSLQWTNLESYAFSELSNSYGTQATVLPRYWAGATKPAAGQTEFSTRLRNPILPQLETTIPTVAGVSAAEADTYLTPVEGGEPVRLGDLVLAGRWFDPRDRNACILPEILARHLGINLLDLAKPDAEKPRILASSLELVVCGIVKDDLFTMQDLDGEEFAPLDRNAAQQVGTVTTEATVAAGGETVEAKPQKGVHVAAKQTILLPYQTVENLGGFLYSVGMVFDEGSGFGIETVEDLMLKAEVSVFVGVEAGEGQPPQRWLYSSVGIPSISGAQNLVVPILIAIGIVLNTMLGSVYERTREIGIYSSVGLAPVHIGVLFIAESLVYAVVGGVAGYMVGQLVTKVVTFTNILPGLTLNYSSMSAVMSSFIVMGVVVLSALYPAVKAAKMAVPDVHRRWKPQWPDGDLWEFDLPFTVGRDQALGQLTFLKEFFDGHEEGSVGVFSSSSTQLLPMDHPAGYAAQLKMTVWLAPFDFGVTQEVTLQTMPISEQDVHNVLHFCIRRKSGDVSNWRRANIRFVNELRKQCLIWRIVTPQQKEQYQGVGKHLIETAAGAPV